MQSSQGYIPALGYHWLTPLYDPLIHRFMHEVELRQRLAMEADILPGMRVLDLGCGTGTLAILAKQTHVFARVTGLDADPQALDIARAKARLAGVSILLEQGMAGQLPFPDGRFDRVLSSLVIHHLDQLQKLQAFQEVYRVLQPGGKFCILDIGTPHTTYSRLVSQVVRHTEFAADNIQGLLPHLLKKAGFVNIVEIGHFGSVFGSLSLLRAEKQTFHPPRPKLITVPVSFGGDLR